MAGAFPNLVSPGVAVREVDLTVGRIQTAAPWTAGIVGPFVRGPVEYPTQIVDENDLVTTFGAPVVTDDQNAYWYCGSSYLSYGGQLRVVRCDGQNLRNANSGHLTSVDLQKEEVGVSTVVVLTANAYTQPTSSSLYNSVSQNTIAVDVSAGIVTGQNIYNPLINSNAVVTGIATGAGFVYENFQSVTINVGSALAPGDSTNLIYVDAADAAGIFTSGVLYSPYLLQGTPEIDLINSVPNASAGFSSSLTLAAPVGINTTPAGYPALKYQYQLLGSVGLTTTTEYTSGIATGVYLDQQIVGSISGKRAAVNVEVGAGTTTGLITFVTVDVVRGSSYNGFIANENLNLEIMSGGVVAQTFDNIATANLTTGLTTGDVANPSVGFGVSFGLIIPGDLITFAPAGISTTEFNPATLTDEAIGVGHRDLAQFFNYNVATLAPQTQILAGVNTTGLITGDYVQGNYILPNTQILSVGANEISINVKTTNRVAATSNVSFFRINPLITQGGDANEVYNANAPSYVVPGIGITDLKILNDQVFRNDEYAYYSQDNFTWASRDPGTWANGMTVCVIDYAADQIVTLSGINTNQNLVGAAVTQYLLGQTPTATGFTTTTAGTLRGVITGVNTSYLNSNGTYTVEANVKIADFRDQISGVSTVVDYNAYGFFRFRPTSGVSAGSQIGVGNSTDVPYFEASYGLCTTPTNPTDWWNNQQLNVPNTTVYWKDVVTKPTTSQYAQQRSCRNDGIAVVVIDSTGNVTQIVDNIAERFEGLSKAHKLDNDNAEWFKDVILNNSSLIFAGHNENNVVASGFQDFTSNSTVTISEGSWDSYPENITYNVIGNVAYTLVGGENYSQIPSQVNQGSLSGEYNGFLPELADLISAFSFFGSIDELNPYELNFILAGPSFGTRVDTQTIANYIISIATRRKDLNALVSPYAPEVLRPENRNQITENILNFFAAVPSSSYGILDSGIKYTFDRFNNTYLWVPCNPDIAGLIARTAVINYPWYSPAGVNRGVLNNAIKIAYNPSQTERDELYAARINPVRFMPGYGVVLFGDKTALGYPSAFDRINVRQLFLYIEAGIRTFSNSVLFDFNDEITRTNYVNQVQPFLREIQTKRGIYDFRVVCDATNNPPEVIDRNEFRADFYIKPARSINFIGLTFVAVRSGDSFEFVIGTV